MQAALSALGALRTYRQTLLLQASAAPVVAWLLLRRGGIAALPLAQVVGTSAALAITVTQLLRTARHVGLPRPHLPAVAREMTGLLRQGALFTIAAVTGSGVANLLPLLVLTRLGETAAGQYRAAVVLSAGYVTVLTTTLGREFLPRASSLVSDRASFNSTVDRQVRIICALATPVVIAGLIFSPIAVRLLFSGEFDESIRILAFQFPGDLLRLVSQTFVYALIAASGGRHMVITEITGGLALLVCVFGGLNWLGLPGLGLATSVAYAIYSAVAWLLLRSSTGFRLSRRTMRLLAMSLVAVTAPTVVVISVGRLAGSLIGGAALVASLLLLIGRLAPRTPPSVALFAHRFDQRFLGPSTLLPPAPTTPEIHS